ncbi:MAG TPA: hypothetical protein PLU37_05770 [Chitinophagaceae bacterium]|nr:hypothetical protein [Chitinophagaceae bacterium]MCB9055178.1 hypothetical protein [Chitinophagales bacterium]HPG11019.1 hypothetical protein [Chitinophagaceae bacterium]
MRNPNHNLLVLLKEKSLDKQAIETHVQSLHPILASVDTIVHFCTAHELVNRNRITNDPKKIIRETEYVRLRPFRFLINKN